MRNVSLSLAALAAAALLASCTGKTSIEGVVTDAPESDVVVSLLDVNRYQVLDTVKTDATGHYNYKLDLKKGQPEFIYLFHGDRRIASLLLQQGDKVKVTSDTLGNYSVTGSAECDRLAEVERVQTEFGNKFAATQARLADMDPSSPEAAVIRADLSRQYVAYYRERVKYILENSKSLTVIPVLYESVGGTLPVFGQATDAIHFRNISDSLKTVYPESRYVKALEKEAARRASYLEIDNRIKSAGEVSFIDIEMPDINGKNLKLSEVDGKVVMVYFWASENAEQKMFNLDVMKPVYADYKDKGFEIYAVSLDTDKTRWASTVRNQHLDWINVCDGRGASSPVIATYNVQTIPSLFFLVDGEVVSSTGVRNEATLRSFLSARLK